MLDEGGSQPYHCLGPSHHQCVPGLLQLVSLLYHLPRSQCNPWHVPAEGSPQWFPICFGIKSKLLPKPCVIWPCPPQPLSVIVFLSVPQSLSSLLPQGFTHCCSLCPEWSSHSQSS